MSVGNVREASSIRYIPGLDGVRALAIAAVMLFHFTAPFSVALSNFGPPWNLWVRAAGFGWVGVDIFFVVSGFLIARLIAAKPVQSFPAYRSFIARRALRLLPAYVLCLLLFAGIAFLVDPYSKVLRNQYLLWTLSLNVEASFGDRVAVSDSHFSMVHFWSLCVEWHFYLLFPLLLALSRSLVRASLTLVFIAVATRVTLYWLGASDNALYAFTLSRLDSIATGCLLACVAGSICPSRAKVISIFGVVVFSLIGIWLARSSIPFKQIVWVQTVGYTLIAISVAMALLNIVEGRWKTAIGILEQPALRGIGRASYSLYLWHLIFFPAIHSRVVTTFGDPRIQYLSTLVLCTALTGIAAALSYFLVEVPSARLRRPQAKRGQAMEAA